MGDSIPIEKLPLIMGAVGEGAGREFYSFCQIYKELITVEEILLNPEKS